MLWYHDHAMGITRLNAYAGIATAYLIRDDFEGNLRNAGLPDYIENGGRELPIVIQEKIFVDRNTIRSVGSDLAGAEGDRQPVVPARLRPVGCGTAWALRPSSRVSPSSSATRCSRTARYIRKHGSRRAATGFVS